MMKMIFRGTFAIMLFVSSFSTLALANSPETHTTQIQTRLASAGLATPVVKVTQSAVPKLWQITLADGNHLLISEDLDYIIQGKPSANPSPATPIDAATQTALPIGTPITPEHRTALLKNMSAMHDMTEAVFYHTGIQGVLWGISGQGDTTFLISSDGRYLMDGAMASIKNAQFSEYGLVFEAAKNRHILGELSDKDLVIYPSKTREKSVLYVASDINCPYCKILHERIDELNLQGVTIKIIGYPIYDESRLPMNHIWCTTDNAKRAALLSAAMKGIIPNSQAQCQHNPNPLSAIQKQVMPLAIMGTPAVFDAQGREFTGDLSNHEIYQFLNLY